MSTNDHDPRNYYGNPQNYYKYHISENNKNDAHLHGSSGSKALFFIICIFAIPLLIGLPPLGALLIMWAAKITNV